MKQYLELLQDVLDNGISKGDRTGTGTLSVFGRMVRYDLSEGFPIITTKKILIDAVIHELLWFLSGQTNIKYLQDNGVNIWNQWADETGELGPVYGAQWRRWHHEVYEVPYFDPQGFGEMAVKPIDQIKNVIESIQNNPDSRRHIVSAWNVAEIDEMKLPPCHCMFQFYVEDGKLSCLLTQRSADIFLGVPFNISSYALLTMMIAQVCDLQPGELVHSLGDLHLYKNHIKQAKKQLGRKPKQLPTMEINNIIVDIDDFKFKDFSLTGYDPHPFIKAPISV